MAKDTKERIAEAALELFSEKGYEAVSIRDICAAVGIRESTIYYHFKNKRDILLSLMQKTDALIEEKKSAFNAALAQAETVEKDAFIFVAEHLLTGFFLDPFVGKLLGVLSVERLHDSEAAYLYRRILYDLPLRQEEAVFRRMMERGLIRPGDTTALSRLYHGVVASAYDELADCLIDEEAVERARGKIRTGAGLLYDFIAKEG